MTIRRRRVMLSPKRNSLTPQEQAEERTHELHLEELRTRINIRGRGLSIEIGNLCGEYISAKPLPAIRRDLEEWFEMLTKHERTEERLRELHRTARERDEIDDQKRRGKKR